MFAIVMIFLTEAYPLWQKLLVKGGGVLFSIVILTLVNIKSIKEIIKIYR